MDDRDEHIRVALRIKPAPEGTLQNTCLRFSQRNLTIGTSSYSFDDILDPDIDQETVFSRVAERIVNGCLEGYNGTIFAYGQTGAGKTYTMTGYPPDEYGDHKGIIPRAAEHLFELLNRRSEVPDKFGFRVTCTFVELYNEKMYDLLDTTCHPRIRTTAKNGVEVAGSYVVECSTAEDIMCLIETGTRNRHVASTQMNRESSRSHSVFIINIETETLEGRAYTRRISRLNLVDLAGSERQSQTKATGERLQESKHINKSLTTLARVIRALSSNASHVPYRDGILTYLLTDSLSGNSRTSFIINVHQDKRFVETTLASAEFAVRLRTIKTNAEVNEDIVCDNYEEYKLEIASLREEVTRLKEDLIAERENASQFEQKYREYKNENSIITGDLERMENRYKEQIEALRFQVQQKEEEQSDHARIAEEVIARLKSSPTALIESFADECETISKRFADSVKESLGCQNKLDQLAVIQKELIDCATKFANDLEDGMHADPALRKQARDRKSRRVTIFAKPRPMDRRVSTLFAAALMEENEEELDEEIDANQEKENGPIPNMKKMTKDRLIERVHELVSNNNELEMGRAQILAENKALDRHIKEITNELHQVKKQLKRVDEFRSRKKERSQTPKKTAQNIFTNVFDETQDVEQLKRGK